MELGTRIYHSSLKAFGTVKRYAHPRGYIVLRDEPLHYEMHWGLENDEQLFVCDEETATVYHCADDAKRWDDGKLHLVRYWSYRPEHGLQVRYTTIGAAALMAAYIDTPERGGHWIDPMTEADAEKYLAERQELHCGAGI